MSTNVLIMPLLCEENGYFYLSFNITQGEVVSMFEVESPQSVSRKEWEDFLAHLQSPDYKTEQSLEFNKSGGSLEISTFEGVVELTTQKYDKTGEGVTDTSIPVADFIEPLYVAIQMLKDACVWNYPPQKGKNGTLARESTVYLVISRQQNTDISVFATHKDAVWYTSRDTNEYIILPRVIIDLK